MTAPRLVRTRIRHVRRAPLHHEFSYRSYSWLVDLDRLPRLPACAGFRARDHLGEPGAGIRANVDGYLAAHGIDLAGGRVLMLANARVLGFVFNPLTVYWCHPAGGAPACVIAEVHNTYGGRHRYLLRTDAAGNATVAKTFYVSPFHPVAGHYRLHLPEPTDRLAAVVSLHDPAGTPVFTATMTGPVRAATTRTVLWTLLTAPLAPQLVALRIRWQGIRLWSRGLPVIPRPGAHGEEAPR